MAKCKANRLSICANRSGLFQHPRYQQRMWEETLCRTSNIFCWQLGGTVLEANLKGNGSAGRPRRCLRSLSSSDDYAFGLWSRLLCIRQPRRAGWSEACRGRSWRRLCSNILCFSRRCWTLVLQQRLARAEFSSDKRRTVPRCRILWHPALSRFAATRESSTQPGVGANRGKPG